MKLLKKAVLSGFNAYHPFSVIRQEVDLEACADQTSAAAGFDFAKRYVERFSALPTLVPVPDGGMSEAFLARLHSAEGASFDEVLLEAIAAVERSMAFAMHRLFGVDFAEIAPRSRPGRAQLIWRCRDPEVSRRVPSVALRGVEELLAEALRSERRSGGRDFETSFRSLSRFARQRGRLSPSTTLMAEAADRRGIPWEWLGGQHLRLGHGRFQRHVMATMTDETSFQGMRFASDKQTTHRLLDDQRLPVPRQAKVDTLERALAAAERIGYPVAVKPLSGGKGGGVTAGVRNAEELRVAFERAVESRGRQNVLVESFVEGDDHRLLVIHGRFIGSVKRLPPSVTGDGRSTIDELVEELNRDAFRDNLRRCKVTHDDELTRLVTRAGYQLQSVLPEGEVLGLRSTANVSTGGCAIDVTDDVHPDNREMAIRAVEAIGLDVGGVDFLTTDISRSYRERGGIVEVNARPGLRPHTWPVKGASRDVAGALTEALFPAGERGRVPVALVAGGEGSGLVARALDQLLRCGGTNVALVTTRGAFVNGEPAGPEGASREVATRSVLRDRRVEAMVGTISPRQAWIRGLGHEECEVSAILGSSAGTRRGSVTRRGLDVLVRATRGTLAVRAGSGRALDAVRDIDTSRLIMVSTNAANQALRKHVEAGGRAVTTVREQGERMLLMLRGEERVIELPAKAIPSLSVPHSRRLRESQLFAVALAYGMGLQVHEILHALRNGRPMPSARRGSAVARKRPE